MCCSSTSPITCSCGRRYEIRCIHSWMRTVLWRSSRRSGIGRGNSCASIGYRRYRSRCTRRKSKRRCWSKTHLPCRSVSTINGGVNCSPMIHQSLEVAPGVVLDARRAVWLADSRTLLIADPHLGYAWAHRNSGNLLPLGRASDPLDRLAALAASYACERIVLLGDVVHDAVHVEPL